ncbi:MAG: hypothetical protein ACLS9T_03700 [Streptococcus salivarius]
MLSFLLGWTFIGWIILLCRFYQYE